MKLHVTAIIIAALLLIAGCSSGQQQAAVPSPQQQAPQAEPQNTSEATHVETPVAAVAACADKDCFLPLANDCNDGNITVAEQYGVVRYAVTSCTFTKTLVSVSAEESQDVKNLLEGRSLSCQYAKGGFDSRWTSSLVGGVEKCDGALKDALARMLVFG